MDPSSLMNNPQIMQMLQDPEFMQLLQEPGMMESLQGMMSNPSAAMSNPRLMNIIQRFSDAGGMGGAGGGLPTTSPSSSSSGGQALGEDLGLMVKVSSSSQYNYKIKDAISKQQPIVVDFTMQGCGPCVKLKPEMVKLSKAHPNILFLLVDNRACPEVVEDLGIQGFPTVIFYSTLNGQLSKLDTVVGLDMTSIQGNMNKLVMDIETRKKQALFKAYKHMPIRESEIIYFKQIQWDKLEQKVDTLLKTPNCDELLYKPFKDSTNTLEDNFTTPDEMLTHLQSFITFFKNFTTNSMTPIKPIYIKVLNILWEWPQDHWSVPLHLFRMAAFHNDFASYIAKGGCKLTYTNAIQRICTHALEISSSINAVLVARALCSCFDKKIFTKTVLTSIDDILGLISYLCLTFQDDNNVITSALALLLNTSYMIYCYAPSNPDNLEKQQVMVTYQKALLSNIIETLPLCIADTQPDGVYKLLIAIGTTLFPYYLMAKGCEEKGTTPPACVVKKHFVDIGGIDQLKAWKEMFPAKDNIQQALTEVNNLLAEIK